MPSDRKNAAVLAHMKVKIVLNCRTKLHSVAVICKLEGVMCKLEGVMCKLEGVMCKLEGVMCKLEGVMCKLEEDLIFGSLTVVNHGTITAKLQHAWDGNRNCQSRYNLYQDESCGFRDNNCEITD